MKNIFGLLSFGGSVLFFFVWWILDKIEKGIIYLIKIFFNPKN